MVKIIAVVPAYNEEETISTVLKNLKRVGYKDIVVVDDGSKDNTYKLAKKEGASVYRHIINRGLGGALNTGLTAALNEGADIIVTFDADLQHNPKDIKKVTCPIMHGQYDVVIGNRISKGMPLTRKLGNIGLDIITFLLFGQWVSDTQSGLRAFSKDAARKIHIRTNEMEVSSEIIKEISHNKLRLKTIPIEPIYTEYSMSKGNSVLSGFKIASKLALRKIMK